MDPLNPDYVPSIFAFKSLRYERHRYRSLKAPPTTTSTQPIVVQAEQPIIEDDSEISFNIEESSNVNDKGNVY